MLWVLLWPGLCHRRAGSGWGHEALLQDRGRPPAPSSQWDRDTFVKLPQTSLWTSVSLSELFLLYWASARNYEGKRLTKPLRAGHQQLSASGVPARCKQRLWAVAWQVRHPECLPHWLSPRAGRGNGSSGTDQKADAKTKTPGCHPLHPPVAHPVGLAFGPTAALWVT